MVLSKNISTVQFTLGAKSVKLNVKKHVMHEERAHGTRCKA